MILHVTNGDSAAGSIERAVGGVVLPWRDVLHEGPVPAGLPLDLLDEVRARFLSERGCGEAAEIAKAFRERDETLYLFRDHEEVVLWFEHDLYDQLQLLQILEWFHGRERGATRLSLICQEEYLGGLGTELFPRRFEARKNVSHDELNLARAAWHAFRSPTPTPLEDLLKRDTSALPFAAPALKRHLEEFPRVGDGLSRSERQALEAIDFKQRTLRDSYHAAHHEQEERVFLGDLVFAWYLEDLSRCSSPLVLFEDGEKIAAPRSPEDGRVFWTRVGEVTGLGRKILSGTTDRVTTVGIDRWLGGVHLSGRTVPWRWDPAMG